MLFQLFQHHHFSSQRSRSSYYRHRQYLDRALGEIKLASFANSKHDLALVRILSIHGTLDPCDLTNLDWRTKLKRWKKTLPVDPHFFSMFLRQYKLWRKFEKIKLIDFFATREAMDWYLQAKKLKRAPLFALDCDYKSSKQTSIETRAKIYSLLRSHPLTRFEDLKKLKLPNAQRYFEDFKPYLMHHREAFYEKLRQKYDL